jgi:hypothetical protein
MGPPGSEGADTWICSDGVGYFGVAVVLGVMWLASILVGCLVAGLVRDDRSARIGLVVLATASVAWILGFTWYGASELVYDVYAPMTGEEYWQQAVGPAAIVSSASLTAAVVGLFLRGRFAVIATAIAALGIIVATVLQPGLGITTVPAAGLLAAASIRVATPSRSQQARSRAA